MSLAWAIYRSAKTNVTTFSEALKQAWKTAKAKAALKAGNVTLTFTKSDGTTTTRPAAMWHGDATGRGFSNPLTVIFSDLSKAGQTSSFRADRLVSFG